MQLLKLKNNLIKELSSQYGVQESEQFFYMLCEAYLEYSKIDVGLNFKVEIIKEKKQLFELAIERLKKYEPIQYVLGYAYFYGNDFEVNQYTLIPRPETEELVDWISTDIENKSINILDIGTGTGCIAILLSQNLTNANVSAIDISEGALKVAQRNADKIAVNINFVLQDILQATEFFQEFDVVVSNPPYVRNLEKQTMSANVLDYEPDSALFVSDNDPLVFYYKIAQLFLKQSKKDAILYFEINEYLGQELIEGLRKMGFTSVEVRKDFREKDRMLKASI